MSQNLLLNKILLFLFLPILFSCHKKTKLVGEYEVLVGEWELGFVVRGNVMSYSTSYDTLYPIDIGDEYAMKFSEKGKFEFYKNNKLEEKYKVEVYKWNYKFSKSDTASPHLFNLTLFKGFKTKDLYGSFDRFGLTGNIDTMAVTSGFPFSLNENCPWAGSCGYRHFYIRK